MRSFVILQSAEVDSINFDEVMENSVHTLRFSLNGEQTFVKYEGSKPSFLDGKDTLTTDEMLTLLAGSDWTESE